MAEEVIKTYIDTSLGRFIFDAYMNINHESTLTITSHPVQDGANVSDHAYMEPNEVTFEVGMSDVMHDISGFDSFTGDNSRSIKTLDNLEGFPLKPHFDFSKFFVRKKSENETFVLNKIMFRF